MRGLRKTERPSHQSLVKNWSGKSKQLYKEGLEVAAFAINHITDFLFIATKTDIFLYSLNSYEEIGHK